MKDYLAPSDYVAMAGRLLYGSDWASPFARQFKLNDRTVRRIKVAEEQGREYPVSLGLLADLKRHMLTQGKLMIALAESIPDPPAGYLPREQRPRTLPSADDDA